MIVMFGYHKPRLCSKLGLLTLLLNPPTNYHPSNAETEKEKKYQQPCYDRRALFTPLCIFVDGMMGKETTVFLGSSTVGLVLKCKRYRLLEYLYLILNFKDILYFTCT